MCCVVNIHSTFFLGVLPLNLNLREFNVFVVTKLNKIFLGSSFATNPQQAKLKVLCFLSAQKCLEDLRKANVEYSIIAELHNTQAIFKSL